MEEKNNPDTFSELVAQSISFTINRVADQIAFEEYKREVLASSNQSVYPFTHKPRRAARSKKR